MAAVSEREDRFIRIKKLVDLGTEALRKVVDTKLLPPAKLQNKLKELEPSLTNRISRQQRNILYPRGGDPVRSCDMDLTLLVFVLRNAVFDKPFSGYGCHPDDDDQGFPANVSRLQNVRNKLSHTGYHGLEEHECRKISHTLIMIIKSFEIPGFPGYDDQIRRIITGSLDYRANSFSWHAPATKESCNLPWYLNKILHFFFTLLILRVLYACLYNIYKSRLLAALVTAICAVFLYLCLFFLPWYLNMIPVFPFLFTSLILIELYAYLNNVNQGYLQHL